MEYLWSRLLPLIFICCWTVVHPDNSPPDGSFRYKVPDRTICLLISAAAHEVLVYIVFWQYISARETTRKFATRGTVAARWSMAHSLLAKMGGFCALAPGQDAEQPTKRYVDMDELLRLIHECRILLKELPTKAEVWKRRRRWLCEGFCSSANALAADLECR
jgi:hypothetical protein